MEIFLNLKSRSTNVDSSDSPKKHREELHHRYYLVGYPSRSCKHYVHQVWYRIANTDAPATYDIGGPSLLSLICRQFCTFNSIIFIIIKNFNFENYSVNSSTISNENCWKALPMSFFSLDESSSQSKPITTIPALQWSWYFHLPRDENNNNYK